MLKTLNAKIFKEKVNGKEYQANGIEPIKLEERSFLYEQLGGLLTPYKPKYKEHVIQTLSTKDQGRRNTCSWNAYTVAREVQENKILSVKSLVIYAKLKGLLSGDGYSTLSNNTKAGCDFGIAEESLLPDNPNEDWETYSNPNQLTETIKQNAATHRADYRKTFYVRTIDEILKAIDDGYVIEYGYDWRSAYNMSYGFAAPWILPWGKGFSVGGHATNKKGYKDLVYTGDRVTDGLLHCQNSYSKGWGLNGDFYVRLSDLVKSGAVGMVVVDLTDEQFADFVKSYEGKFVGHAYSKAIWKIEDGKKRAFPNDLVFKAFGGKTGILRNWTLVSRTLLEQVPDGADMDVVESPLWPALSSQWDAVKTLKNPDNFKFLEQVIKDNQETIDYYNRLNGNIVRDISWIDVLKSIIKLDSIEALLAHKLPVLGSSADATKIALSVKGALITITPIIIYMAGLFNVELGQSEWNQVVEGLWQFSNQIIAASGTIITVYGLIRKLLNRTK